MGSFVSWIKDNLPSGQGSASATTTPPQSAWGMIDTLVPVLLVSLVYIVLFLYFRRSQRRFYAPRTYLGSLRPSERSPDLPGGWFDWFGTFWKIPDAFALSQQGLDAYLFLRYLRVATVIAFVSMCITWPILFPVNATGGGGQEQLEILSYSNIDVDKQGTRFYAHAFVGWVVYGFVMYMIMRECIFFINLRQAYLLTPHYARRISARTVLFTGVPDDYLDEARIRQMFNDTVRRVWIAGRTDKLEELVEERDKVAMKLEGAEVSLIKMVNKERLKAAEKSGDGAPKAAKKGGDGAHGAPGDGAPGDDAPGDDAPGDGAPGDGAPGDDVDVETGNIAARYVPDKKRPSHRIGFLGLVGKKVDTIEWSRSELQRTVPETEKAQAEWAAGAYDKVNAVFVEFRTQGDAQAAYQVVTHHQALRMCPKFVGVRPAEVVWKSLSIPWWQVVIRRYAVYAFIAALIVFWAIPVAIVGLISQVSTLQQLPGLTWLKSIPKVRRALSPSPSSASTADVFLMQPILGVVSGLLPSVALAILMSLVPVIMRWCAKLAGSPTLSRVELFTQNAYFCFQVVQVFLIRSMADAASTAIVQIVDNPSDVFSILGAVIPTSSNFYISYFMLQGLTIATSVVTQVVGMFVFRILYKYLTGTPRSMYTKWTSLSSILWGSLLPVYTNIICISIIFSVIAPFMLFWSTLALVLFHLAYRYNVLFVSETAVDTQGQIYPRALKQLFVGVYIAEISMVGLFAVSKAAGPAALMAVFLIFSVLFQITMSRNLDPLLYGLPRSVQAQEQAIQERHSAAAPEEGLSHAKDSNESSEAAANGNGKNKGAKKGNFVTRFFKPWVYADYETLRKLMPLEDDVDFEKQYTEQVEAGAYFPPSVTSKVPTLWIPRDPAGVSAQEVALTSKVIPITDEGASLDDENNIVWDTEGARPPIWDEKVCY
ncbi:Uncharacterized protein RSN1 [Tolypocladium capitatum]|uniref:Uncharacterized protein RSN1 n=1 Tax=Tolypocladium capitatum TaxID=45235 RepID=A0A2K3QN08_9HYPO|nr:Uncharacterized protein RSN1 [Tolypocladium capitatum]